MKNLDRFMEVYVNELAKAVEKYPQEYAFGLERVNEVTNKMKAALERGTYNKDGRAIKATCKYFGIKHTYTAINQFLKGE